ncbi:MAG: hypothetical protein KDK30_01940 [Leptospiraceae bacterium]|nr:hypothetical protein [Leptospiraceae bacterium]
MQNLDFSPRIKRYTATQNIPADAGLPPRPESEGIRRINRSYVVIISLIVFAFTLGLLGGMKIQRMVAEDRSVLVNPDDQNPRYNPDAGNRNEGGASFSNQSSATLEEGRFLIKIGTFNSDEAERLTIKLNQIPELVQMKPYPCTGVRESGERHYPAFRVPVQAADGKENVFLGCFLSDQKQLSAMQILREKGVPGTSGAQPYELTGN